MTAVMLYRNNRFWKLSTDTREFSHLIATCFSSTEVTANETTWQGSDTATAAKHISLCQNVLYFQTHFFDIYSAHKCALITRIEIEIHIENRNSEMPWWWKQTMVVHTEKKSKDMLTWLNTRNSSRNVKLAGAHLVSINKWRFLWVVGRFSLSPMDIFILHVSCYHVVVPLQKGRAQCDLCHWGSVMILKQ